MSHCSVTVGYTLQMAASRVDIVQYFLNCFFRVAGNHRMAFRSLVQCALTRLATLTEYRNETLSAKGTKSLGDNRCFWRCKRACGRKRRSSRTNSDSGHLRLNLNPLNLVR